MTADHIKDELLAPWTFDGEVMEHRNPDEDNWEELPTPVYLIFVDIPLACGLPREGRIVVVNGIDRVVRGITICITKKGKRFQRVGIEFQNV